jgi:DNA-binding IclR family transcriptional regulator
MESVRPADEVGNRAITTSVGVVDKSVSVLAALADGPLDLAGLQMATRLPRATAHRLAVALEAHGLLRRDRQGRFCLGWETVRLGRAAMAHLPLVDLALPVLQALGERTGESVQLYVREGDQRRCIATLESTHGLRWIVPLGSLLPLDRGSAGKVLLGQARLAESVEEREAGVASVSAAVTDAHGTVVGAVSLSGPVERLTRRPAAKFGQQVEQAARQLGQAVVA